MVKLSSVWLQYLYPQHLLTYFTGWLAECRWKWFKNWAIKRLIRKYHVNMEEVLSTNLEDYPNFNSFFTRHLKPEARPIVQGDKQIACPVDGIVSQVGAINNDTLFQAKGIDYSLTALLGGFSDLAREFIDGNFVTMYLAPKDYHRVHIPLAGKLRETIYIPGDLFSVNPETVANVPNLFTRNERLVCLFDTSAGTMAVILVGAMLVGNIQTVWPMQRATRKISRIAYSNQIELTRGDELGFFKMGSTVVVLFGRNQMSWQPTFQPNSQIKFGMEMGNLN